MNSEHTDTIFILSIKNKVFVFFGSYFPNFMRKALEKKDVVSDINDLDRKS